MRVLFSLITFSVTWVSAQTWPNPRIPLWSGPPPGNTRTPMTAADSVYVWPFPAASTNNNGAAIVVCPGGGYSSLSLDKEGAAPAAWFQARGFSTFVLKYRLGAAAYRHPIEMWDVQRAMRWVRANAQRYGINPNRVGVLGFSAGGHLASTVGTHYDLGNPSAADTVDRQSCRPDFQLLLYPVITMDSTFTHSGSRTQLLGSGPNADTVIKLSNEKQVTPQTPMAFLAHGMNDATVPYRNGQVFYDSCVSKGVVARLIGYANGPHGFGLANGLNGSTNLPLVSPWPDSAIAFLTRNGLFTATGVFNAHPSAGKPLMNRAGLQGAVPVFGPFMETPRDVRGRAVKPSIMP